MITQNRLISKLNKLNDLIKKSEGRVIYLLQGKKGIGKTRLLTTYCDKIREELDNPGKERKHSVSGNDIVVYLDLRTKKIDSQFLDSLPIALFPEILFELKKDKKISPYLTDPVKIRELDKSYGGIIDNNTLAQRVSGKDKEIKEEIIQYLFGWACRKNYRVILIVDNISDFSLLDARKIIYKCIEFKDKFSVRCIIAIKDYWHPQKDLEIDINDYELLSWLSSDEDEAIQSLVDTI